MKDPATPQIASIRRMKALLSGGVIILMVLVMGSITVALYTARQEAVSRAGAQVISLSAAVSSQMEATLRSQALVLHSIQDEVKTRSGALSLAEKDWYDLFQRRLEVYNLPGQAPLFALFYVDAQGTAFASSVSYPSAKPDASSRDYFRFHRDHPEVVNFISPLTQSKITGLWVIYLTQRVTGPRGEFFGVVGMSIRVNQFDTAYKSLQLPEGATVSLFRADGAPLFRHPFLESFAQSTPGDPAGYQTLVQREQGAEIITSPFDQKRRMVGFTASQVFPLISMVSFTEAWTFKEWISSVVNLLGLGAAAFGVFTFLLVFSRRQLTKLEISTFRSLEAEAANRAKSRFVAHISHEIRTPLHAVLGMIRIAREEPRPEGKDKLLDKAAKAGSHLLQVINDILDYARIESGKMTLTPVAFTLPSLFGDLKDLNLLSASEKGLSLQFDFGKDVPTWIEADVVRIRQILQNLIANGIKFTEKGAVGLRVLTGPVQDGKKTLRFEVWDTGPGIPDNFRSSLFESFSQADGFFSRSKGGTGLGLAISRRLALLMGGLLDYQPRAIGGSLFYLQIPYQPAEAGAVSPSLGSGGTPHRFSPQVRILVAEDKALNRELMENYLKKLGLTPVVVKNGQEAVDQVKSASFHMVFMDWQMPVLDGMEATAAIRKLFRPEVLPIVAITANAFEEDRQKLQTAGFNDVLIKPMTLEDLETTLVRWLKAPLSGAPSEPSAVAKSPVSEKAGPEDWFEPQEALKRLSGDGELYLSLLQTYLEDAPGAWESFRDHWQVRAGNQASSDAHLLKGMALTVGCSALGALMKILEADLKAQEPQFDQSVFLKASQAHIQGLSAVEAWVKDQSSV